MSASKERQQTASGDIWRRHESLIRDLYLVKNKTSKDLKSIMEEQHGFSNFPVSTWIQKLGELGIGKNLPSSDWRTIYQHIMPMLKDPARGRGDLKAKRTKAPIEIVYNGRIVPWTQAWRKMRRAGAMDQQLRPGEPLPPLPPNVSVRTPGRPSQPILTSPSRTRQKQHSMAITVRPHDFVVSQQGRTSPGGEANLLSLPDHWALRPNDPLAERERDLWLWFLLGSPIDRLHHTMTAIMLQRTFPKRSNPSSASNDFPVNSDTQLRSVSYAPRLNFLHQFLRTTPLSSTAAVAAFTGNKYYAVLFAAIYLLSNKLVDPRGDGPEIFDELDHIFANIPGDYIKGLLHERLSSVKAAFESLIMSSAYSAQRKTFSFLVDLGARFGWLVEVHELLYYAISLGLPKAQRTLLDSNFCLDLDVDRMPIEAQSKSRRYPTSVIVAALRHRDLHLAQQLIRRCNVNESSEILRATNFDTFLAHSDEYNDIFEEGLALFLEEGLDVDNAVTWFYRGWPWAPTDPLGVYMLELDLSILDYLFHFHRPSFQQASLKSNHLHDGHLSRTGVLLSLEGGKQGLQDYLDGLIQRIDQEQLASFFNQMIVEQFLKADVLMRKISTDLGVVRDLISYGARMKEVFPLVPNILELFLALVGGHFNSYEMEAAQYLIENGATVNGISLSWLARLPDTSLLDLVRDKVDGEKDWVSALVHAAAKNNLKAVERLLLTVVDFREDLLVDLKKYRRNFGTLSIIANVLALWDTDFQDLPNVLEVLIRNEAPLRLSARKPHLHHLLLFTLHCHGYSRQNLSPTLEYIIDAAYDTWDPSFPPERLLKACIRYKTPDVIYYLLSKGAWLPINLPVSPLLQLDTEIDLVREILDAGADIDAYTKQGDHSCATALQTAASFWRVDIIELLLQRGAEVNAPAKGWRGATALQASCTRRPETTECKEQQIKTVSLLLESGANVNAPPARIEGMTALQLAAYNGDFAVQQMLFPKAYVNAPPCQLKYDDHRKLVPPVTGTALDRAAENGRLDMVHFLLKCNAVSHHRGDTGYDGAIQVAESYEHFAVAELIRQYVEDNERRGIRNQSLTVPPMDWSDYGIEQSSDDGLASGYQESETDSSLFTDLESGTDQATDFNDAPSVAYDGDAHGLSQFLSQDERPAAAAARTGLWEEQQPRSLQQEFVTAIEDQPLVGQEEGPNAHLDSRTAMDLHMGSGSDLRLDSLAPSGDEFYADDMDVDLQFF